MPKPAPQIAMQSTITGTLVSAEIIVSATIPTLSKARPMPPSKPGETLSDMRPAIGAAAATITGHAVMRKPVWTGSWCSTSSK